MTKPASAAPVKERLLQATIELIREQGPAHATARAICDRVGVKQPALYHHYGQLNLLHQEAVSQVFIQAAACYLPAIRAGSAIESIRLSWRSFIEFAANNPELYSFINQQIIKGELPASVARAFEQLVEDLQRLNDHKPLREDPYTATQMLWASANGAATLAAASAQTPAVDTRAAELVLNAMLVYLLGENVEESATTIQ